MHTLKKTIHVYICKQNKIHTRRISPDARVVNFLLGESRIDHIHDTVDS